MFLAFSSVRNLKAQQTATASIQGRITAQCLEGACPQGREFNLIGAKIILTAKPPVHAQFTATSDDEGLYELSNVEPGSYSLEVTLAGFKPYAAAVTLSAGEASVENIQMEIAAVRQQIEVRARIDGVAAQSVAPPATLTAHQVLSVPLSQKQKFVDALPLVPGVVRTPEGKLNMKGAVVNQGMMLVNYVGSPNSQCFPTFFSLDVKLYRDFDVRLPFFGRMKTHRLRLGVYSLNITNHYNPNDVFHNVASPIFGHFVGFEHRVDGMVIDVVP